MAKTSIAISDKALDQGKLLASARKHTFSELVEDLILRNFDVKEITKAAVTASEVRTSNMVAGSQEVSKVFEKGSKLPITESAKGEFINLKD